MNYEKTYAFDYETRLLGAQQLAPKGICLSIASIESEGAKPEHHLIANGDDDWTEYMHDLVDYAIEDEEVTLVAHNAKFDMHVMGSDNPDLYSKICKLYDRGQIHCTILVEKLLNLTTSGKVACEEPPPGKEKGRQIEYNLAALVKDYLGIDISEDKKKADAVRTRYQELDGLPAKYYPAEFRDYAINDSVLLIRLYEMQIQKAEFIKQSLGFDPLKTLQHRCSLDFHLYRFSMEGVRTNPEQIAKLEELLKEELTYEKLNLLYPEYTLSGEEWEDFDKVEIYLKRDREKAVLKPSAPARPGYRWSHKKGCPKEVDEFGIPTCGPECFRKEAKDHLPDCKKKSDKFTRKWLCDCPPKMVQSEKHLMAGKEYILDEDGNKIPVQKDMLNEAVLKKHILDLWKADPESYDLMFSDSAYVGKSTDFIDPDMNKYLSFLEGDCSLEEAYEALLPNVDKISIKAEWMDAYAHNDPILSQYAHRASLIKLQTTEIPRMKDRVSNEVAEVVHGNFDVLKETGRTSGFAASLYPSANLQNVHKMARTCFKARPGHWILSTDYSGLEFVSAAQRALDLLGESTYAKVINNGWDSHSYLAAQRAVRSEDWFREEIEGAGISLSDYEAVYHKFMEYKKNDKSLGFYEGRVDDQGNPVEKKFWKHYRNSAKPIGLGLLGGMGVKTIARVSAAQYGIDMTPDEAKEYKEIWEEIFYPEAELLKMVNRDMVDPMFTSKKKPKFRYETPMGLVRPNCSYAACANGSILQSPSAEGATLAMIEIAKACYDPESTSILKGNFFPWCFCHDEVLGDVVADPKIATEVLEEVERIMVEQLQRICPDIVPNADSALMITWNKAADELYNREGYMIPFEAKKDEQLAKELGYVA